MGAGESMDAKSKKDWLVRICCFIAAFSLWLYVSNEDSTQKTVKISNVEVQLINKDAITEGKLVLMPNQKINITLSIRGQAMNVYSAKADQFKIVADMGTYSLKKGENRIPVEIKSTPDNINVVNADLWVKVNLDALVEKSVPVKTDIDVKTKAGYYSSAPVPKITQVTISGAASYVNSVQYVLAKKTDVKDIDKDTYVTLPLQAMDGTDKVVNEVKIDPSTVDVMLPVKKSKSVSVNLKTKGTLPNGITLKTMNVANDSIEVSGAQQDLNKISSLDTEPIDLSSINTSGVVKAKLVVPENVTVQNGDGFVDVNITIDKIVQKTISRDIQIKNLDSGLNAKLDKTKATIVIQGNESTLSDAIIQSINCYIDLNGKTEGTVMSEVVIPPIDGVTIVSSDTKTVNVTINKK